MRNRLAFSRIDNNNVCDIWILDLGPGGVSTRFTFDPVQYFRFPVWSPDGSRVIFSSSRGIASGGTYEKPANGIGTQRRLPEVVGYPSDWSRDGRFIVSSDRDLWVLADGKSSRLTQTDFIEGSARFSPDGRWIAYTSDESKRIEVWVQSFPASGTRFQISTAGGTQPHWSSDGKELFYIAADGQLMATAVKTSPTFEVGSATALFKPASGGGAYEVTADGRRFLLRAADEQAKTTPVVVMTNWLAAAKR